MVQALARKPDTPLEKADVSVIEEEIFAEKLTLSQWEEICDEARREGYAEGVKEGREQGQKEGVFRPDIPLGLAKRLVFGTLDEVVSTWVLAGRPYDLETLADPIVDLFLKGIQQDPQGERKENEAP